MMSQAEEVSVGSGTLDPLLARYAAAPETEAPALLVRLLREEVEPTVERVLGSWSGGRRPAELADLRGEVLVQLLKRLQRLREQPAGSPIADLHGYVATVARNLCRAELRQQHPERERLRRRLWHLLRRGVGFETWRDAAGRWLVRHKAPAAAPAAPTPTVGAVRSGDLKRFAADYLDRSAEPVAVAELVATATAAFSTGQPAPAGLEIEDLPDPRQDAATALLWRDFLGRLWAQIRLLPSRQAAALLLGLRDREGRNALIFLPATGTASLRQIAEVLGLPPENLAEIWNQLPLPDLRIAEILGLTRQQVINLRKSARERLARRMETRDFLA